MKLSKNSKLHISIMVNFSSVYKL